MWRRQWFSEQLLWKRLYSTSSARISMLYSCKVRDLRLTLSHICCDRWRQILVAFTSRDVDLWPFELKSGVQFTQKRQCQFWFFCVSLFPSYDPVWDRRTDRRRARRIMWLYIGRPHNKGRNTTFCCCYYYSGNLSAVFKTSGRV